MQLHSIDKKLRKLIYVAFRRSPLALHFPTFTYKASLPELITKITALDSGLAKKLARGYHWMNNLAFVLVEDMPQSVDIITSLIYKLAMNPVFDGHPLISTTVKCPTRRLLSKATLLVPYKTFGETSEMPPDVYVRSSCSLWHCYSLLASAMGNCRHNRPASLQQLHLTATYWLWSG